MKCQLDEEKDTVSVKMRFPIERRHLACYELPETAERETREAKSVLPSNMEVVKKMASGIAHELNNTLTSVIGNADLLLSEMRNQEPAYRLVQAIMEAGERGARLGKDLLIIGRGHPIKPVLMNLNDFILSMKKTLGGILGRGIQCQFFLKPDLMPVKADPFLMEQLILNLLSNAREAMPKGGVVKIATENSSLDQKYCHGNPEATPGDHATLILSDTGTGMAPDMLSHLFEPYPNVKPGGGGLGLAIVYSIVKQLHGHITVHSKKGEGTTFQIYIPSFIAAKEAPKPLAVKKSLTLLVVESEAELLGRIHSSFAELGYAVIPVESSEQALSEISNHAKPVDLLVTEVVLPGKSGIDLAKSLWTKYPRMKTIFLTSCPEDWKSIFKDAVQVVTKPVDLRILLEKVRQALREQALI